MKSPINVETRVLYVTVILILRGAPPGSKGSSVSLQFQERYITLSRARPLPGSRERSVSVFRAERVVGNDGLSLLCTIAGMSEIPTNKRTIPTATYFLFIDFPPILAFSILVASRWVVKC
jgi:hypothetical protein